MTTVTTSKMYRLKAPDWLKSALMAAGSAVATALIQVLSTTPVVINYKQIAQVGVTAGLIYLTKNFFTPSKTIITNTPTS